MQNESTSPEAAESVEPVDTYEEAFAKKLAKSRVENLNVGKLETEEEKKSKKILIISLIAVFALLIGGAAGYYFAIYKPEQDRLAKEAAEAQAAAEAAKAKEQVPLEEAVKEPDAHLSGKTRLCRDIPLQIKFTLCRL